MVCESRNVLSTSKVECGLTTAPMVLCWHPTEGGAVRRVVPLALVVAAVGCGGSIGPRGSRSRTIHAHYRPRRRHPPQARPPVRGLTRAQTLRKARQRKARRAGFEPATRCLEGDSTARVKLQVSAWKLRSRRSGYRSAPPHTSTEFPAHLGFP